MENVEDQDGDEDEHALEADEEVLALHDGAVPTLAQLRDAEGAADEDAQGREGQGAEEALKAAGGAHGGHGWGLVEGGRAEGGVAAAAAEGEVGRGDDEAGHSGHLEGQAGDHDVCALVGGDAQVVGVVGAAAYGGDGAAGGLEDEGDDIAGDELRRVSPFNILLREEEKGGRCQLTMRVYHVAGILEFCSP